MNSDQSSRRQTTRDSHPTRTDISLKDYRSSHRGRPSAIWPCLMNFIHDIDKVKSVEVKEIQEIKSRGSSHETSQVNTQYTTVRVTPCHGSSRVWTDRTAGRRVLPLRRAARTVTQRADRRGAGARLSRICWWPQSGARPTRRCILVASLTCAPVPARSVICTLGRMHPPSLDLWALTIMDSCRYHGGNVVDGRRERSPMDLSGTQ